MSTNSIFSIRNLKCQYKKDKTVLSIKELDIPKGNLVFVLGLSGVGKSTFIETLGLMNATIAKEANSYIHFSPDTSNPITLHTLWEKKDQEISSFRNEHFSFIFQNTKLMPYFTAGENMCISQLIYGKKLVEVKSEVLEVMKALDLVPAIFDRKVTELSGGQIQRIAFVRAVIAKYHVLFGDEPTGNLDRSTAFKLMRVLKSYLGQEKTGIIVSHDIELALAFADQIIILNQIKDENNHTMGEALPKNVLYQRNENWSDLSGNSIITPAQFIKDKLITTANTFS